MAIVFDLDDTLFDHAAAMERFLREELAVPDDAMSQLLELDARGRAPRPEFCAAVARVVGADGEAVWERLQDRLGEYVVPAAQGLIEEAASRFDVAILTNGGVRNQSRKLAALAVDRLLPPERVLISAAIGVEKPERRAFELAVQALGRPAAEVVYVGDDPHDDVMGAGAAGLRTCWLARGRVSAAGVRPDWTIEHLAELRRIWDRFPT